MINLMIVDETPKHAQLAAAYNRGAGAAKPQRERRRLNTQRMLSLLKMPTSHRLKLDIADFESTSMLIL